jgi:hypothetical protein
MRREEIKETVAAFAEGARRAREARPAPGILTTELLAGRYLSGRRASFD